MHSIDPFANHSTSQSTLGATLLRLRRHVDANRQREQASLELFQAWQSRWSDHRELIARHLECLDRELAELTISAVPAPHLTLLALSAGGDEEAENAGDLSAGVARVLDDNDDSNGVIPSTDVRWGEAQFPRLPRESESRGANRGL